MSISTATAPVVACIDRDGHLHKVPVSKLTWRPSAYSIVIRDDKLLVCRSPKGCDLPGGRLMLGETPEAAALRETKEETGIDVRGPRLIGVNNSFFKFTDSQEEPDPMQCIMLYYRCDYAGGDFVESEMDAWELQQQKVPVWYPLDRLDGMRIDSSQDFRPLVKQALGL